MTIKILKNTKGSRKTVLNREIENNDSYTVPHGQWAKLADHEALLTDIRNGFVVVNDGTKDLSVSEALKHIFRYHDEEAAKVAFNNSGNGFLSTNVQAAIEEARNFNPQATATVLFDDFYNQMTWSPSTSGTGSSASVGEGNAVLASGKHLGVARLLLGNVPAAHAALVQSGTLSTSTVFGDGAAEYQTLVRIPTPATATDDYIFRCGMGTTTNADHTDGIYFEYSRANSPNWRLKTALNSIRTTVTSSLPVTADSWIHLRWVVNSAGTNVDFYIDGTLAGSITTNISTTTGRGSGPNYQLTGTAFLSASRIVYIDYFYFAKTFTARD